MIKKKKLIKVVKAIGFKPEERRVQKCDGIYISKLTQEEIGLLRRLLSLREQPHQQGILFIAVLAPKRSKK